MTFIKTVIRLLTGRIAYERRAALLAAELGAVYAKEGEFTAAPERCAARIYHFLIAGEFPS